MARNNGVGSQEQHEKQNPPAQEIRKRGRPQKRAATI